MDAGQDTYRMPVPELEALERASAGPPDPPPGTVAKLRLLARLHRVRWAARRRRGRRWLASRAQMLAAAALMTAGGLGGLAGGWLIARWALGLVVIAESAGLVWLGLNREIGGGPERWPGRGARTVEQVLDDERLRE